MLSKAYALRHFMNNPTHYYSTTNNIIQVKHYDLIKGNVVINPLRNKAKLLKKQFASERRIWQKYAIQSVLEQCLDAARFTIYDTETHDYLDTKTSLKALQKNNIHYVFCTTINDISYLNNQNDTLLWGILDKDNKAYVSIRLTLSVIDTATGKTVYQSTGLDTQRLNKTEQIDHLTEGTIMNLMDHATQSAMRKLIRGWAYSI